MLGEFAPLKSKHDSGVAKANQQNLLNVIANKVKQSFLHCHCEPKARQSFLLHNNGLPRRYAPRNDDGVACNGLPRRYAPRNDDNTSHSLSLLLTLVHSQRIQKKHSVFLKRINHTGSSTNWLAPKVKHDCNVCGKSMIEMLGVLAIIGVLSVGGIAGYSKAMSAFRLNKWRHQVETLIFNIKDSYKNERQYGSGNNNVLPTLKQIGAVPQNMLDANDQDLFGNKVILTMREWKSWTRLNLQLNIQPSDSATQICNDLFSLMTVYTDVLWSIVVCQGITCTGKWLYRTCGRGAPPEYIYSIYHQYGEECWDYNLEKVMTTCKVCATSGCVILILFDNNT